MRKPRTSRVRRLSIGVAALALCLAGTDAGAAPPHGGTSKGAPAKGSAPSKGSGSSKHQGKGKQGFTQGQMQAAHAFAEAVSRIEALKQKQGRGTYADPFRVLINPGEGGGGLHLCKVKGSKPPKDCVDPGPRPSLPDGFKPPCTLCDESKKDDLWDDYIGKQLAADALHKLLELHKELEYWGAWGDMIGDMVDAVGALTGPGSMAFKAIKYGAGELVDAATEAAKEAAMEAVLQGIIDALGLDLEPGDLSTEGGLNAAIALADAIARDAMNAWRAEFNKWAKCRQDAIAAGKLPLSDQSDVDACNDEAAEEFDEALEEAWQAIFDWEGANNAYEECLEENKNLEIEITQYQTSPCPPGTAVGG